MNKVACTVQGPMPRARVQARVKSIPRLAPSHSTPHRPLLNLTHALTQLEHRHISSSEMQSRALVLLALLGLAQYAAAGKGYWLLKHHEKEVPPVAVSGARQCQTVPELAAAEGNFTVLLAAAKAAGLDQVLGNPALEGTLFAPTDAAFAALLKALGVGPADLLANTELLGKVLKYHFVPIPLTTSHMGDGVKLPTLLTKEVDSIPHYVKEASMLTVDKSIRIKKAFPMSRTVEVAIVPSGGEAAQVIKADIPACKVIVQVIDTVLVPDLEPQAPKPAGISGVAVGGGYYGA